MKCAYHPYNEAVATCVRCEKYICVQCLVIWQGNKCCYCYCRHCSDELSGREPKSPPRPIPVAKKAKTKTTRYLLLALAFVLVLAISLVIFAQSSAPTLEPAPTSVQQSEPAPTSVQQSEPSPETVENPQYIYEDGAIHVGGDGEPIELINNPNATNLTYAELVAFIKEDSSDEHYYADNSGVLSYVCSDFAETVHNNAEAKGIRAAWVGIEFKGGGDGHALNAFETTDRGLVYIDCTGGDLWSPLNLQMVKTEEGFSLAQNQPSTWDKVVYVEIGEEYGAISITNANSLLYSSYEEYKRKWQQYKKLMSDYNDEVTRYTQEIRGKIYYEGSPELARIEAWEVELEEKSQEIDELGEELGDFWFEPLGIVEDVFIRW